MSMETENDAKDKERLELQFDLGTFEGFNFRQQSAIWGNKTADEVVNWDHDRDGEAEFWPSGDNHGVHLVFRSSNAVSATELIELDRLLGEMGGDSDENFLRIHYAKNVCGCSLEDLTAEGVEDENVHIFLGDCFTDVRKEAAYELFELYWPEEYKAWEGSLCDGLIFDPDRFLDSPAFSVDEVKLGDTVAVLVAPQ
jgi:hypothetical protein